MEAVRYEIDGATIGTTHEFFDAVGGRGTYFGANLDAFADCLSGGFGTPEDRPFYFVLKNSEALRAALGRDATLDWLHEKLLYRNPRNTEAVLLDIDELERGTGPTLFDILVQIFDEEGVPLELA